MKRTLVLGASIKKERFSYLAMKSLTENNIDFVAIGAREGTVFDVPIRTGQPEVSDIHTVSLYINPKRQKDYYDYILSLNPQRIIFNPGTENGELFKIARENNIEVVLGCTLVMLHNKSF